MICYREQEYDDEPEDVGCYMIYFKYNEKKYCVDATSRSNHFNMNAN